MRKIILGLSILSIILTAGIMMVEASDDVDWREKIKAKMEEFKEMTPEERRAEIEEKKTEIKECKTKIRELKNSEEWQNASKEEREEMLKELDCSPHRGIGFGRVFGFGNGFKKGLRAGMEGCGCECEQVQE